jgi:hypothetical protein
VLIKNSISALLLIEGFFDKNASKCLKGNQSKLNLIFICIKPIERLLFSVIVLDLINTLLILIDK